MATPAGVVALGLVVGLEGEAVPGDPEAGMEGAVIAGLLASGEFTGGFGAKNLAHNKITAIERIEAIRIRISEESSFFFCGSLTNEPL